MKVTHQELKVLQAKALEHKCITGKIVPVHASYSGKTIMVTAPDWFLEMLGF